MPVPVAPETIILEAARTALEASDIETVFELEVDSLTVRHYRHRPTLEEEMPCIALALSAADQDMERQEWHTHSEIVWKAYLDLIVDMKLLPENADPSAPASDTNDATGWDRLVAIARYAANILTDTTETAPLRAVVDDIIPGDIGPDEDSQSDNGRLEIGVYVIYRTRSDDLMALLPPGGNA